MNSKVFTLLRVLPFMMLNVSVVLTIVVAFSDLGHGTPADGETTKPECDAHLDSRNAKVVVVALDLTRVSRLMRAKNIKVDVVFVEESLGKTLGKETFSFTDGEESLAGGRKYVRRFEYDYKRLSASPTGAKAIGAEAVIAPDLGAVQPK
jgi:ribosomal protein L7Ae-like RNA K-turn-binding protein